MVKTMQRIKTFLKSPKTVIIPKLLILHPLPQHCSTYLAFILHNAM